MSGPVALTITRIEPAHDVESERGTTKMAVFFFRETEKGMCLNVTNNGRMVECYDRDPRKWIGKKIVLKSGYNQKKAGVAIDVAATLRLPAPKQARQPAPIQSSPLTDEERALADAALAAEQAADDPGAQ